MVTTNEIYRCEELELDATSIYDDLNENEDTYDELNKNQDKPGHARDPECIDLPPLPTPRPLPGSPDEKKDNNYEGLNKEEPADHIYLLLVSEDASASRQPENDAEDQVDQGTVTQEQE